VTSTRAPSPTEAPTYEHLRQKLAVVGLVARGGFHPQPADALPEIKGRPVQTLVLLGFTGTQGWPIFANSAEFRDGCANPLDRWSMRVIDALADELGGRAFYPSDGPPWWPFQRWARRALALHVSPLGVLIDPTFGLWHSYRGALALPIDIEVPVSVPWPDPCSSCESKHCLNSCPVGAVQPGAYDVDSCRSHVRTTDTCRAGCQARRACPVGAEHAYASAQANFYMRAFAAAGGVPDVR
jgi:ferredoxin